MSESSTESTPKGGNIFKRILKIAGWTVASILTLFILIIVGVTLYLTPERLSSIISEEASKELNADIKVFNADYTLWSSFPYLHISVDSLNIHSRSLDKLPEKLRKSLPANSGFLASTGTLKAGINLLKAFKGEYDLRGVEVSHPVINLVEYNDSINNFSIIPGSDKKIDIPRISVDTINIPAPLSLSYSNISSESSAQININNLIAAKDTEPDTYHISFSGDAKGSFGSFDLSQPIPVDMDGIVRFRFNPIALDLSGFSFNISGISSKTDLDMSIDKEPVINSLKSYISSPDIIAALSPFAKLLPPQFSGLSGNLPIKINCNLNSPLHIADKSSSVSIPSFDLYIESDDANLAYPLKGAKTLRIADMDIEAGITYDKNHPETSLISLKQLDLTTDDTRISLSGEAKDILSGQPAVNADLKCVANLKELSEILLPGSTMSMDGAIEGDTKFSFRISDIKNPEITDLKADGNFKSPLLKIKDKANDLIASISAFSLNVDADLPALSTASLTDARFKIKTSAAKADMRNSGDSVRLALGKTILVADAGGRKSKNSTTIAGDLALKTDAISSITPSSTLSISDVAMDMKAAMLNIPWQPTSSWTATTPSPEDSIIEKRVTHTPLYLSANIPSMMQTILSLADIDLTLSAREGELFAESYPAHNRFSNLTLQTDLDTLAINSLNIASRSTSADISGKVKGLRAFLLASSPTLLDLDLDARFDDVNINELSGTYYAGVERITGKPVDFVVPAPGPYTAADSICVVIPRNLVADIRLHSDRAEYKSWQFSPLSTEITLHDGIAKIGKLCVGAEYGSASVDWTYSTADLNNIFMQLNIGVNEFDFNKFLAAFPSIASANPELSNLSASISADAEGKFLMYPSMFLNTPSLSGEITLNGDGIEYKRDKKTARITHFLLLKGDGPLKLDNFTAHGSFHDNLLQVDPFTLKCGKYEILLGGVNNLQGEIYYHLGLMHSPFHFPFGVNIVGNYHHPKIRFGGNGIKDGREREISADLYDSADVNIMRQLRQGWLLFVENAAKYDATNNHDYVFNVR